MWDDHSWLVPRIRAALDAGVPPTAIILRDPGRKEYGPWDLKLAAAYRIYDDLMRGAVPIYWDESDRVAFDVGIGYSKSRAAMDRREDLDSQKKDKHYGRYYYPIPRTIDGGPLPTPEEWATERRAKMGNVKRPPVG